MSGGIPPPPTLLSIMRFSPTLSSLLSPRPVAELPADAASEFPPRPETPLESLYGKSVGTALRYRRDALLDPWVSPDVAREAVHSAFVAALDGEPLPDADTDEEPESDFAAHVVGGGRARLRTWASCPARYLGGGARLWPLPADAPSDRVAPIDPVAALAAHREAQEEARAIVAELPLAVRRTLAAMRGDSPRPAIAPEAWRKRCQRARAIVAELLLERGDDVTAGMLV